MKSRKLALMLSLVIGVTSLFPNITYAATQGWEKSNGVWYFYENGNMKTGWIKDSGKWYYLNSDGSMKTGWVNDGGTWYYLNDAGDMATGWKNVDGTWYYLKDNGAMAAGWLKDGGEWYYLNNDGSMKTGWLKEGSYWYYLSSNGTMLHDCIVDRYLLNSDGQWPEGSGLMEEGGYSSSDIEIGEENELKKYTFSEALNKFSVDSSSLVLSEQDKKQNCMYSPMSVFMALSVLSEGADKETKDAILKTINISDADTLAAECKKLYEKESFESETGKCSLADSVWLNNSREDIKFEEDTINGISKKYGADIFTEDLTSDECAEKISKWVLDKTYGMLGDNPQSFKAQSADTMIEIFNAIYFKDKWENPFYVSDTKKDKFNLNDGSTIDTDFMNDERFNRIYHKENEYKVSSLSFKGGNSMAFILPAEGKSVYDIIGNNVKLDEVLKCASSLDTNGERKLITYKIPKFKFKSTMDLNSSMKELGLAKAYDADADFSKFAKDQPLFVSDIKQDSSVVADESGAEAAAVTEVTVSTTSCVEEPPETDEFILDRPFIFAIMDKDNTPMFIGVVNNPTV